MTTHRATTAATTSPDRDYQGRHRRSLLRRWTARKAEQERALADQLTWFAQMRAMPEVELLPRRARAAGEAPGTAPRD